MFGDKKQIQRKKSSHFHESSVTILTPGCHFTGKLHCRGSSRIGGQVEGEIFSEGLLIIEEEASITASIVAEEAVIQGTVKGRLEAKIKVELTASSRVEGDIVTPKLIVNEGAIFNGQTFMSSPHIEDKKKSLDLNNKKGASKAGEPAITL